MQHLILVIVLSNYCFLMHLLISCRHAFASYCFESFYFAMSFVSELHLRRLT
jgi:hypothetical protein